MNDFHQLVVNDFPFTA